MAGNMRLSLQGFQSVNVSIHAPGGHSSEPPIDGSSVLEVMGRLLTNVSTHPPPLRLVEPVPSMLRALALGVATPFQRFLFEHSDDEQVLFSSFLPDGIAESVQECTSTAFRFRICTALSCILSALICGFNDCQSLIARQVTPILLRTLAEMAASVAALVRTTVVATVAHAGLQDNVLPESGSAVLNFRRLPGNPPSSL